MTDAVGVTVAIGDIVTYSHVGDAFYYGQVLKVNQTQVQVCRLRHQHGDPVGALRKLSFKYALTSAEFLVLPREGAFTIEEE